MNARKSPYDMTCGADAIIPYVLSQVLLHHTAVYKQCTHETRQLCTIVTLWSSSLQHQLYLSY